MNNEHQFFSWTQPNPTYGLTQPMSISACFIYLTIKKSLAPSQTVANARIAPKICQGQPPTMCSKCPQIISHWRSYSRMRKDRFCPVEYFHDRLFEPKTIG